MEIQLLFRDIHGAQGVFKGLAQNRPFANDAGTTSTRVITSD
jgi:hypothetical protein